MSDRELQRRIEELTAKLTELQRSFAASQRPRPNSWLEQFGSHKYRFYSFVFTQATASATHAWHPTSVSGIKMSITGAGTGTSYTPIDFRVAYSASGGEVQVVNAGTVPDPNQSLYFLNDSVWLVEQSFSALPSAGGNYYSWNARPALRTPDDSTRGGFTVGSSQAFGGTHSFIHRVTGGNSGGYKYCWLGQADIVTFSGPPGAINVDVPNVWGSLHMLRLDA